MTQWGLDTLFNPAKRHMDEEKRRLQSTREEVGDTSGGKRIDLESGKVVIRRATEEDEPAQDADGDAQDADGDAPDADGDAPDASQPRAADDAANDAANDAGSDAGSDTAGKQRPEPSAAAIRAARRRGREPR